jgi:putative transposase
VLNRGIERRTIFPTRRCNERFIELLSSLPERFGVQLHAYALMGNHYHLPLESREANLSQAMHWLNVSCSVWFNRKYTRVGPLFQGRFKAILHETTAALMINRYIHLNPVRIAAQGRHENGGIASQDISEDLACRRVDALEQYCWSSYAFFAGERPAPNGYDTIFERSRAQRNCGFGNYLAELYAPFLAYRHASSSQARSLSGRSLACSAIYGGSLGS